MSSHIVKKAFIYGGVNYKSGQPVELDSFGSLSDYLIKEKHLISSDLSEVASEALVADINEEEAELASDSTKTVYNKPYAEREGEVLESEETEQNIDDVIVDQPEADSEEEETDIQVPEEDSLVDQSEEDEDEEVETSSKPKRTIRSTRTVK